MTTAVAEEVPVRLEVRPRKWSSFNAFICSGLVLPICLYILIGENNPPIEVILSCVFLIFALSRVLLFSARDLFKRTPVITINQHGIEDLRFGHGLIEWADITSIAVLEVGKNKYLSIEVIDPKKYLVRLSTVDRFFASRNRFWGGSEVCISSQGLSHSVDEIHNFIFDNYSG